MTLAKLGIVVLIPLGLILSMLTVALWSSARGLHRGTSVLIFMTMAGIWLAAMPITARWAASQLEIHHDPLNIAEAPRAQAIVALGGGIANPPYQGAVSLGPEADRLWLATLLWRADKAPLILISGGGAHTEAELGARLLLNWSVPEDALILESTSLNTRQNATGARDLLSTLGINQILLVTTAIHMPRAAGSFRKVGFAVTPFPVDFISLPTVKRLSVADFLPQMDALATTSEALQEWIAWLYYRLRGWA